MSDCSKYCDHFWGSHGCDIPPDEPHEVHECRVTHFNEDDEPVGTSICSQMRVIGPLEQQKNGWYGRAQVRHGYLYSEELGEWRDGWEWFKNCPPPMTVEFTEEG